MLSKDALVSKGLTGFPLHLIPHIYMSIWEVTHTSGISIAGSVSNSSLRILLGLMSGSWMEIVDSNFSPITLVLSQWKKQCTRSAWTWPGHSLQSGVVLGRILDSLCSVGRSWWRSFQRKLVAGDPSPFSLDLDQVLSQSFEGQDSSALDLINSLLLSISCMVSSCSTMYLYH